MTQQSSRNPNDFLARQRKTGRILTLLTVVVVLAIAGFGLLALWPRLGAGPTPASVVAPDLTPQPPQTVVTLVAQTIVIVPPTVVIVMPTVAMNTSLPAPQSNVQPVQTPAPVETPITPVAIPTRSYLEPKVLEPSQGKKFSQIEQMRFNWVPVGTLLPSDQYRVQVSSDPAFATIVCEFRTRDNNAILSPNMCNGGFRFNNLYYWHIEVVVRDVDGREQVLSSPGTTYQFGWQP